MILSLTLVASLLTLTIKPPVETWAVTVEEECTNGYYASSAREVEEPGKSMKFVARADREGECVVVVTAYRRDKKVLKVDKRHFFPS